MALVIGTASRTRAAAGSTSADLLVIGTASRTRAADLQVIELPFWRSQFAL